MPRARTKPGTAYQALQAQILSQSHDEKLMQNASLSMSLGYMDSMSFNRVSTVCSYSLSVLMMVVKAGGLPNYNVLANI